MDIVDKTIQRAALSRLSTVEAAFEGREGAANNFKGTWAGFDSRGNGQIVVNGKTYSAPIVGSTYIKQGTTCYLRVAENIMRIGW